MFHIHLNYCAREKLSVHMCKTFVLWPLKFLCAYFEYNCRIKRRRHAILTDNITLITDFFT